MSKTSVIIRPVEGADADELFPMVYQSPVTATLIWDGPPSLDVLRETLREREVLTREGKMHQFTIVENSMGKKVGSISIRPFEDGFRADVGIWVGIPFHGKGYGAEAVRQVVQYGFDKLQLEKIEAKIFTGNQASRRLFEKAGFQLEGTIRAGAKKRGKLQDEWLFGILKSEFRGN